MTGQAPRSGALDLHEEISHADPSAGGCQRWPEHFRLLSSNGELVRGRCGATNLCSYCARLAAVENAELLALDALAGSAPEVWMVLTTRTATLNTKQFWKARELVLRALKRRWPACEYAVLVEFTTGYGTRSGGRRRPHWNWLLKGIPADDAQAALEVASAIWCANVDAKPGGQYVGTVGEFGGLMRYLALHFQKESQAPPAGWRGHRLLKSRGYLASSTPEARAAAKTSLRHKRELWRQIRRYAGLEEVMVAEEVALLVEQATADAIAVSEATDWRLVQVNPATGAPGRRGVRHATPQHERASELSATAGEDGGPGLAALAAPEPA